MTFFLYNTFWHGQVLEENGTTNDDTLLRVHFSASDRFPHPKGSKQTRHSSACSFSQIRQPSSSRRCEANTPLFCVFIFPNPTAFLIPKVRSKHATLLRVHFPKSDSLPHPEGAKQ